ncbi:hypothetical protein APUTEX25_003493, partial [Auxenochlorella protothecoides]
PPPPFPPPSPPVVLPVLTGVANQDRTNTFTVTASGYFLGDINVYKDTYLQYTWVPATKTMTVYTITPPSTYASGHVSVWYVDVYDANNVHIGKSNSVTLTTP